MKVLVPYRVSDDERQAIAFLKDFEYDKPAPKLRKATRAEILSELQTRLYNDNDYMADELCRKNYHKITGEECAYCNSKNEDKDA